MLIDSHSHLHFPAYKDDLENVLARMKEKSVTTLTVGTSSKSSLEAVEFSKTYGIPCSVGFHPSHVRPHGLSGHLDPAEGVSDEEFDVEVFRLLLKHNPPQPSLRGGVQGEFPPPEGGGGEGGGRIVAIGECGLDYFRLPNDGELKKQFKQKQREVFEAQIALAQEFGLPLIIHTRASKDDPTDAYRDTVEIIEQGTRNREQKAVMHCYLGNVEYARTLLDLGCYLSFSGIVTFKNADAVRESARYCPPDRILSETDCPYLAPEPFRGKRNEPSYVEYVVRKLEELQDRPLVDSIKQNCESLFSFS